MSATLHILAKLQPWINNNRHDLAMLCRCFDRWSKQGLEYAFWVRHRPRRWEEIHPEGSAYMVWQGEIRFRCRILRFEPATAFMPEIERRWENHTAIVLDTKRHFVEPRRVGWVRSWRYLPAADAPPDAPSLFDGTAAKALDEIGVVK